MRIEQIGTGCAESLEFRNGRVASVVYKIKQQTRVAHDFDPAACYAVRTALLASIAEMVGS